ncbi:MAG: phytanoyl-CoA dioxygenase family protein, partial [Myxococcota bacterium]|nr:phytanoyl-CoA dioxygenase family protein [Myxococcota bacterium]
SECEALRRRLAGRYTDSATGYGDGGRLLDGWRALPPVAALAAHPRVCALLELFYRRRAIPFQTLNFEVGTEQRAHSDAIHFDSVPHGFMCGVWVALEDVDGGNGPLFVVEGSHRLPRFDLHDIGLPRGFASYRRYEDFVEELVDASGLSRRELHLRRGQAVVWAANLLHGGTVIREPGRTRLSQVTHYYFEDCLWFQPLCSDLALGELALKDVVDVRTGRRVPHRYRGRPVRTRSLRPRKSLGEWGAAVRRRLPAGPRAWGSPPGA